MGEGVGTPKELAREESEVDSSFKITHEGSTLCRHPAPLLECRARWSPILVTGLPDLEQSAEGLCMESFPGVLGWEALTEPCLLPHICLDHLVCQSLYSSHRRARCVLTQPWLPVLPAALLKGPWARILMQVDIAHGGWVPPRDQVEELKRIGKPIFFLPEGWLAGIAV